MGQTNQKKILLVLGKDRFSAKACRLIGMMPHVQILIDCSSNRKRVFKLIERGRLSLCLVLRMLLCEVLSLKKNMPQDGEPIHNNAELLDCIQKYTPETVLLFRAGLIINQAVLSSGITVMNIHCADIPDYGGIGAIYRALKDRQYHQNATLHQVTETIDKGVVYDKEPYLLDPKACYCTNENKAYDAGITLLKRTLA